MADQGLFQRRWGEPEKIAWALGSPPYAADPRISFDELTVSYKSKEALWKAG